MPCLVEDVASDIQLCLVEDVASDLMCFIRLMRKTRLLLLCGGGETTSVFVRRCRVLVAAKALTWTLSALLHSAVSHARCSHAA